MPIMNQRLLTQDIVLAQMMPGTRYSLHQIARLVGASVPNAQRVLADCIGRGVVRKGINRKRDVYWSLTADELSSPLGSHPALPRAIMQAYDAGNSRFRDLCLVTRTGRKNI